MVTEVPAFTPFKTQVSHGTFRELTPPVPFPEIVVVAELLADTTLAVKSTIENETAKAETSVRATNLIADERREHTDTARRSEINFLTMFTTNSALEI